MAESIQLKSSSQVQRGETAYIWQGGNVGKLRQAKFFSVGLASFILMNAQPSFPKGIFVPLHFI